MEVAAFADYESLSRAAAERVAAQLRAKPRLLLCAASGSTPHRTYELLAEQRRGEPALFEHMRLIKLDEWGGLPRNDPATCESHLQSTLVEPLGLQNRYTSFDSAAPPQPECERIAAWLRAHGPIDLCILGLGLNGHLGFNEPAEFLQPHAHVAKLSQSSLTHAMLSQSNSRPTHGLTLGMADLLQASEVLLLVAGSAKRAALSQLMRAEITPQFPASFLWLHPQATVLCDAAARS